jgi:competence protein ComEC
VSPLIPTVAAQVMALPLLLDRFHALPWAGLATNLLAVPVCGALLSAAWIAIALEWVLPGAGAPFLSACEPLAAALRWIANTGARLPGALLATGAEPGIILLSAAGAAALALSLPGPRALTAREHGASRARLAALWLGAFAGLLALALAVSAPSLRPPPGRWWLVALDVGQGDAIALGFADGWWLVDAGPRTPRFDAGESTVLPFLRWAGVRRLERLVVTHDDGDHSGGASAVLRATQVRAIVVPVPVPDVPGPGVRFAPGGAPLSHVSCGDILRRAPTVEVCWPPARTPLPGDNAASLVLKVGAGEGRALLAADVDSVREHLIEAVGPFAALKVAHHGSGSSSGAGFLARTRPALAVVTCGRRNAFGHPDAGALARIAASGARIARTDREGAVWLEFSDDGAVRLDWRRSRPSGATAAAPPAATTAAPPDLAGREPRW